MVIWFQTENKTKEGIDFEKESIHPGFRGRDIHQKTYRRPEQRQHNKHPGSCDSSECVWEATPDLNGDGVVNIQDLVIVANAF